VGAARAVVVSGPPAAGKSALGAGVAARLHAALLDQDIVTGPLTRVVAELVGAAPGDLDDPRVREPTRKATYDALAATAAACLAAGTPTVLVAPFTAERGSPAAWQALVNHLGAPAGTLLVWAACPPDELIRRMRARDSPRDQRKLKNVEAYLASPALVPPAVPHVVVDTTRPLDEQVAIVLQGLPER